MKQLLASWLLGWMSATAIAQPPQQVVQANLDAYNNRNIEAFMASFPDTIALYVFPSANPAIQGKAQVRKRYQELFDQSPQLHSTILSRIVLGKRVIDHERITGRNGSSEPFFLVMIYEVEGDRIVRMTAVREAS